MHPRYRILVAWVVCLAFFAGAGHAAPATAADDGWKVGLAKAIITPEQFMWMAGYASRDRPAEGKLTELWAKALVLQDASGQRAVLVTLDVIGVSREMATAVAATLKERHGLERSQLALCASHTHSGPVLHRNLSPLHDLIVAPQQRQLIEEYTATLQNKILAVIEAALADLKPAELAWASGTATFAVNRRNNPADQVPQLRAEGKLRGPFDHDVPVLAVRDLAGKLQAVVFGYACHATTLAGFEWCGDFPGYAQIEVEQAQPGCQAMFWAGCGADQNPLPRRTVELAMDYGRQLATAVNEVLNRPMQPVAGKLATDYREIDLPLAALPTREQIEQDAQSKDVYAAARAKLLLTQMADGRPLSPTYPYPVQVWRLGDDIRFIVLGGEVVVDFALRLKSELGGPRTWVAGYSNDVMAYIASRRVLQEGGYEGGGAMVYYGLPTSWAVESEDLIVAEAKRQAGP
jgi:neutral ceramidase